MTVERPNTLAGLVEKRAEIAGEISHTRAKLRQLIIDLDHVDAAIRIFDPSYDVDGIRQKFPAAAHRALRGDLTRAALDALRDAPGPMTTKELARARQLVCRRQPPTASEGVAEAASPELSQNDVIECAATRPAPTGQLIEISCEQALFRKM
jgi:hypothetical protein